MHADIILAINAIELYHIKHCTTLKDVLYKLKEVYESKRPAKLATLLKILLFKKIKENEIMNEHINTFFNIVDKLKEMDIKVVDDLLLIPLLYIVYMKIA